MSGRVLGLECPSFIVDSKKRDSGTVSNFTHQFEMQNHHTFNQVAMISCRIPKTYYLAQSNTGILSFNVDEGGIIRTVTVPEGNYSYESFRYVIEGLLNGVTAGYVYVMSFPNEATEAQTNKYTFTLTGTPPSQPIFIMTDNSDRIVELLGFEDNAINTFNANVLSSSKPVRFEYTAYVTVRSSISRNGGSSAEDSAVLARIPVGNVGFNDYIEYNMVSLEDSSRILTNSTNNSFSFSLYDDRDELINLRQHHWSCTVMVYEYNNASELSINDLRLKYLKNPYEEAILTEAPLNESQQELTKQETGAVKAHKIKVEDDRLQRAKVSAHHAAVS